MSDTALAQRRQEIDGAA